MAFLPGREPHPLDYTTLPGRTVNPSPIVPFLREDIAAPEKRKEFQPGQDLDPSCDTARLFFQGNDNRFFNRPVFEKGMKTAKIAFMDIARFDLDCDFSFAQKKIDFLPGTGALITDWHFRLPVGLIRSQFHENKMFECFSEIATAGNGIPAGQISRDPHIKKIKLLREDHSPVF